MNPSTLPIAVVFANKAPLGIGQDTLVAVLQDYLDHYLTPAWGVPAVLVRTAQDVAPAYPALIFADDSDQARALGYHDLEGTTVRGFVFVRTSQDAGEAVSITASHELAEMLLDPACNLAVYSPRKRWIAREICDPVQGTRLALNLVPLANFVLPSWYGAGTGPYDMAGVCKQAWEIQPGGYVPVWDPEAEDWHPLFGSMTAADKYQKRGAADALRRTARRNRAAPRTPTMLLA